MLQEPANLLHECSHDVIISLITTIGIYIFGIERSTYYSVYWVTSCLHSKNEIISYI